MAIIIVIKTVPYPAVTLWAFIISCLSSSSIFPFHIFCALCLFWSSFQMSPTFCFPFHCILSSLDILACILSNCCLLRFSYLLFCRWWFCLLYPPNLSPTTRNGALSFYHIKFHYDVFFLPVIIFSDFPKHLRLLFPCHWECGFFQCLPCFLLVFCIIFCLHNISCFLLIA